MIGSSKMEVARTNKATQKTISKIIKLGEREPLKAAFLTRAIEGLIKIADSSSLVDLTSVNSNYEVLLAALQTPEALSLLTKSDPLAMAKLRGLKLKQQLIEAEKGCGNSEEIAQMLGVSRQAINQRRQRGKLIGLPRGKGKYLYPLWQFTDTGKTIKGLETVLSQLQRLDPWMQITFFLNPNVRLENKTPLEMLRREKVESVVISAIVFANDELD